MYYCSYADAIFGDRSAPSRSFAIALTLLAAVFASTILMGTEERRIKPYIHSPIARAVYERLVKEQEFANIDRSQWYHIDLDAIRSENVRSKFIQLSCDEDTQEFIEQSTEKSSWLGTQLWHAMMRVFLGWATSKTSLNGWLNRGSMFVLSEKQFLKLTGWSSDHLAESVLDLGAGDGNVTARFSRFFKETYVTEVSLVMRKILARRGYSVKEVDAWSSPSDNMKYSMIAALNLLDRCDEPITILKNIPHKLAKDGIILLALVLPVSQYVENNPPHYTASQPIEVRGRTMEDQIDSLVECVLVPLGYILKSWSRLPYLCEGDLHQPYYWLHDVILVLQHETTL
ncbi:methyltransferase-like protein 9 [Varroa jacobsoni]|uniref:Methyltransferase-like protein 9 n=1 Tax=Varroa destructor TaxID=109461 RepID=A0A7M7K718_VARDE|nr:methyltransferase-like protein 9 [Varroa destructor]XP_022661529.1 methyltransferase-like protein 9 [Varroa destructor]XP_022689488.1 methyltransferase-like protein 9 [Varroa jacobsoni]XP_022689489.1 methyltransferase-like protein 9 [Varroa jacobsoni]